MMKTKFLALLTLFLILTMGNFLQAQCPNNYTINQVQKPYCPNSTNGYLTTQQTTYYSGSTFLWSNGATDRYLYNIPSGHYTVTITDPTTCTYTATTYLGTSPVGVPVAVAFNTCYPSVTASSNAYPLTYLWSDGSTQSQIDNPVPGTYSVTVTDGSGCQGTATGTVLPYNPPMSASHTSSPATCNASNGSINLTVTGGTPPYTYYWNGVAQGQTVQDPVNVPVGVANVSIRDANNCYLNHSVSISGPQVLLTATNASCGLPNGSVVANPQNIASPTYLWSNGATTSSITGLGTAGNYTVTVSGGGCVKSASAYVGVGGTPQIYLSADSMQGCTLEEVYANAYGGAPYPNYIYNYAWSTGETTTSAIFVSGVTNYSVTVTDANGCSVTDTYVYNPATAGGVSFSSIVQDATCGNSDGAIDMTVSGGVSSYSWSPTGATTEDITGIAAGHHILTVMNWNGCSYSDTIAVGEFVEFTFTDASCGMTNGSATVHDFGMTNPTFVWSTGATTAALNNLAGGVYTVTTTNGSCVLVNSVTITDAGMVTAGVQPATPCAPDYITAVPTGGASPFSFVWDNAATTQNLLNPIFGNSYAVTITDANGCTASTSYQVPNFAPVTATYAVTNATCNNKNGEIYLTMTGGSLPYNYAWSLGGGNVKNLIGVWPGQYAVNITDNNGCVLNISNMVVGGQNPINVTHAFTYVNASNTGGAINLTVTGVTSPTFQWSTGAITEDISNLSSGHYYVTIIDPSTSCAITRHYYLPGASVSNPNIKIRGRVADVSATATCTGGLGLRYEMVRLMPGGLIDFTDVNGYYEFNITAPGNYTVEYLNTTPLTTNVLCPVGAIATITGAVQGGSYYNNFYLTNPPSQDFEIDLFDYSLASPGFPYYTRVNYKNKGNTIRSGTIEYDYNALLGFQSITGSNSTLTLHDIPNHKFNWSFANMYPGEQRSLDIRFTVPTFAALGTGLQGTATIFPVVGDATPSNNVNGEYTTIVGSWDPNDKQVEPYHTGDSWNGGIIYQSDEELEYTIRFQNTGSAPAHVVVIRDTLDANLIPTTVRDVMTKHDADVAIENGNILVFTFNNIYLPDSSADFEASMGFVKFKVNRQAGLPVGTQIENTAAIYFDFNAPIITNTPISIIDINNALVNLDNSNLEVETMPNPFNEQITLKYTLTEQTDVTIRVFNSVGQVVYTHVASQNQQDGVYIEQLKLNDLTSGMYLLTVETKNAVVTRKILKQ